MEIGTWGGGLCHWEGRIFPQVPARRRDGTSARGHRRPRKAQGAIHPRFTSSSIPTSRSVRSRRPRKSSRHVGDHLDRKTEELLRRIKGATTLEEIDAPGKAFAPGSKRKACCWSRRKTARTSQRN